VLEYLLQRREAGRALAVLRRPGVSPELLYKFAPALVAAAPGPTVDAWLAAQARPPRRPRRPAHRRSPAGRAVLDPAPAAKIEHCESPLRLPPTLLCLREARTALPRARLRRLAPRAARAQPPLEPRRLLPALLRLGEPGAPAGARADALRYVRFCVGRLRSTDAAVHNLAARARPRPCLRGAACPAGPRQRPQPWEARSAPARDGACPRPWQAGRWGGCA
jgi:hypothetical protein